MITAAIVLAITALLGLTVLLLPLRWPDLAASWLPGAVHGACGVSGFVLLASSLGGPRRGVRMGAGSFGIVAAELFGATLLLATVMAVARLRRKRPNLLVIGLHATLAVGGLTLLAAYLSFPA